MKKRLLTPLLVTAMIFNIAACGNQEGTTPPVDQENNTSSITRPATAYDNSRLDSILLSIEADFADSIKFLQDSFSEVVVSVGDTYEKYLENKQLLANYYDIIISEETALFERTIERAVEYMNLITTTIDHHKEGTIDDAMDELYDRIYDDAMEDFYEEIYDDLMDDAYDEYYDGIVEDGYDVDPYEKWSKEYSEAYQKWSDTSSNIYRLWSDTSSQLYRYLSCVNSGFYKGNFDVDSIIAEYEKEKAEKEAQEKEAQKSETSTDDNTSKDIRPEFKEAMDSYEAFFVIKNISFIPYEDSSCINYE